MKALLATFFSGVLFALGLGIAGMTQPSKVLGFLDIAGRWDPSLAFVMVGAIGIFAVVHHWTRSRATPLFATAFVLPTRNEIDGKLLAGAALFGIGWGLGGLCPGPALTALATGAPTLALFVGAMLAGMALHAVLHPADRPAPSPR